LGKHLYGTGIFGFISLDLLVFPTPRREGLQYWAIGLDCFMNKVVSTYFYFQFLVR
jgi:hypothetical protein